MTTIQAPPEEGTRRASTGRRGDFVFAGLARASALVILAILAGVFLFLLAQGAPALDASGENAYGASSVWAFVWPFLYGTIVASAIAMLVAAPLSIGLALVISHYAPRKLANPLGWLIDLLAAIPSVVYGLWGIEFLALNLVPVYDWLQEHLSWIPLFAGPVPNSGKTILTASIVLAVMVLPISTAICREVFLQTPAMHQEAALALGATRWEMIRMTVFPYGRSGMMSALLLGLGRALGETMAVALIISIAGANITANLLSASENDSMNTIAANIAQDFGNASGTKVNVLIFSGLVLFVITFAVNFFGRRIALSGLAKG